MRVPASAALLLLPLLAPACGDDPADGGSVAEGEGEGEGAEGEGEGPQVPPLADLAWDTETVAAGLAQHARMRLLPDGTPLLAWFRHVSNTGACDLGDWGTIGEYDLVVATRGEAGWEEEVVIRTDVVYGLGLDVSANGTVHLAFLGGEPGTQWCGGSDLVVATGRPGAWAPTTVQTDSATSTECRKMQSVCNQGNVTGLWPALAFSPSGDRAAIAFQDVHFGFAKEDWESADQELAVGPGGWAVQTVHDSFGAGRYADVALDASGRIGVAWYNGKEGGIWFSAEGDEGFPVDGVQVDPGVTGYPLQLEALPAGGWGLAFFHSAPEVQALMYARSDDGETWRVTGVDETAHTGLSPAMAVDSWGRPVIAYGRCNELGEDVCHENRDGVMLARWDGTRWRREEVPGASGEEHREGDVVALALTGDGLPRVAWLRSRFDAGTGEVDREVQVALAR